MRAIDALWMLASMVAVSAVAACATSSSESNFRTNVETCRPMPVPQCLSFLESRNLAGRARSEVLMSLALSQLMQQDPSTATLYLNAIIEEDPGYALAFQNRGSAYALLASEALARGRTAETTASYLAAATDYEQAIRLDPSVETNYATAAAVYVAMKDCTAARSIWGRHDARFGSAGQWQEVAAAIDKRCP